MRAEFADRQSGVTRSVGVPPRSASRGSTASCPVRSRQKRRTRKRPAGYGPTRSNGPARSADRARRSIHSGPPGCGCASTLATTGTIPLANVDCSSAVWSADSAEAMSGEWNAPPTARATTFPSALHAVVACSIPVASPATTVWSGRVEIRDPRLRARRLQWREGVGDRVGRRADHRDHRARPRLGRREHRGAARLDQSGGVAKLEDLGCDQRGVLAQAVSRVSDYRRVARRSAR